MKKNSLLIIALVAFLSFSLVIACSAAGAANAAPAKTTEIKVMCSGGFYAALKELAPVYEQKTGAKIVIIQGASMGSSPTAIPTRLKKGEEADLVIMAGSELDKLINDGLAVSGSRTNLVLSKIGMVVRAGAPKPDISTSDAFVRTVLAAKSLGYSSSASGVYLEQELFPRLGIWEQIKNKSEKIVQGRVGDRVASGDLELGFQQVSELLPIPGVDFVGALPDELQKITIFSAGIAANSKQPDEGKKFVRFLTSRKIHPIIIKQGLEPAGAKK